MQILRQVYRHNIRLLSSPRPLKRFNSTQSPRSSLHQLGAILQKNLVQRNTTPSHSSSDAIRCLMFNFKGEIITSPDLEFKREDLIRKHGLLPRDLRKVEKSRKNELVPIILVRENCMLVSLLNVRALVKSDMVLLFDPVGINLESKTHTNFINSLQQRLRNKAVQGITKDPLPFEFRALETIFIHAISNLTAELRVHAAVTKGILNDLEYSITSDKLKFLLVQNKKFGVFYKKSLLLRDMIDELLEQDDELSAMYLTENSLGRPRAEFDHNEIEMLLETYYTQVNEIVQSAGNIISNVRTTAEIINIILDSNRNELMLLGLRFSVGLLSLGSAIFVGSLYGMNLENFIEETDYGFPLATTFGMVMFVWLFGYSIKHVNRLQKMTLSGSKKVN
ncbi:HDR046Cp [Eremothecium sinecaudum]|uniref:Magnesium transporter n=1 Tax=Eremothecium sinecaudum TaxID=45286 RepID=A0A109UZ05_9SACH|nr:HDR046Cp [Eremothecium sinecaudum]AMD20788.1 HDR046Cp [Eremothecium sinecaudum]